MSGEPKTLTLEEAVDLAKKYMIAYLEETSWPNELREKWPEELDADYRLLFEEGVRVAARDEASDRDDLTTAYLAGFEKGRDAARDEAAELRAANHAFVAFMEGHHRVLAALLPSNVLGPLAHLWNQATALHDDNLRRLAGGESER